MYWVSQNCILLFGLYSNTKIQLHVFLTFSMPNTDTTYFIQLTFHSLSTCIGIMYFLRIVGATTNSWRWGLLDISFMYGFDLVFSFIILDKKLLFICRRPFQEFTEAIPYFPHTFQTVIKIDVFIHNLFSYLIVCFSHSYCKN